MAEGGTNTLFLAVGFLRWTRSEGDSRSYRAPLLLLPVKLDRRLAQSEYRLSQLEDEVRINSTPLEMLKRDFELRIPDLEGDLPRDESGLDIPHIMEILRQRVRDVAGFEVVEECALSTFSFAKYLMWKDLVDRTDSLRESRLVAHLVNNPTEAFEGARTPMPHPADIDRKHAPGDLLAPLPADSSQLAAVLAAAQGRDFVLIGPPGTGKSQTITNIIADQLGRGRTVLFVAEKSAALDVVHRRLERHGFASITADQIDTTRTRARGVADLKAFLDFANRGPVALAAQDNGSAGPAESPFEEAVRDALAAKGWEVHSQIGVSGFQIDLGVRHPDHAGVWLAGVECDGARYHSSATARDRDRIRQAVLEGLGWKILRIWSTDWFRAPVATISRIDGHLRALLETDRERRAEEDARQDAVEEAAPFSDETAGRPAPAPGAQHTDTGERQESVEERALLFADKAVGASSAPSPLRAVQPSSERFFDDDYSADRRERGWRHAPLQDRRGHRRVAQCHLL